MTKYYHINAEDIDKLVKYLSPEKQEIFSLKRRTEIKKILF